MRRAIAVEPNRAELHDDLGALLVQQGLTTAALNEFSTALALQPSLGAAHLHMDMLHFREKSYVQVITELNAAINGNAGGSQAHYYLGQALRDTVDSDGAIRQLQAALQVQPDFTEDQNSLSV